MGNVAKFAISGGKKVASGELISRGVCAERLDLTPFYSHTEEPIDFEAIKNKILTAKPLSVHEIEGLLRGASLPLLMKLVELVASSPRSSRNAYSAYRLDGEDLERALSQNEQSQNGQSQTKQLGLRKRPPEVLVEGIDWINIDPDMAEELIAMSRNAEGGTLLGPSILNLVERVVEPLVRKSESSDLKPDRRDILEKILCNMKSLGISKLVSSSSLNHVASNDGPGVRIINEQYHLPRYVTEISDFSKVAAELETLSRLSSKQTMVQVWMPIVASKTDSSSILSGVGSLSEVALDFKLLRVLAVGSLVLTNVPFKRASLQYLSPQALSYACQCGANEIGFGSTDHGNCCDVDISLYSPREPQVSRGLVQS